VRIFVLTSDHYIGSVRAFAFLFNQFWSKAQEVIVAGFKPPTFDLPSNFHFHSLGNMVDYPVNKWSDALIKLLHDYPDEVFALFLEDYWLSRPVNVQAVQMLYDYMHQFRNVLKMDLYSDRLYAGGMTDYNYCGYLDLIRSDPASQYHMSLMAGLWNRDLMLRFLIPGESPWQVELEGTPRVARAADEVMVLGTRNMPVRHILAHRRGNPKELLLDGLDPVDVEALRGLGYI
jgi:hypothetical protein